MLWTVVFLEYVFRLEVGYGCSGQDSLVVDVSFCYSGGRGKEFNISVQCYTVVGIYYCYSYELFVKLFLRIISGV